MLSISEILEITTIWGFAIRLLIAAVLGFCIGLERQWTKHQAGILTNVIVCVGAYAYTAFSYIAAGDNVDVTRIAAQVASGIGFLGAGLIIRDGTNIRGLSTAATIWATAAVGILCTTDNISYSFIVAITIVIFHLCLHPFSAYIDKKNNYDSEKKNRIECFYKISINCAEENETDIRSHLLRVIRNKNDVRLHNLESTPTDDGNVKIRAYIATVKKNDDTVESILAHIGKDEGIKSAGWKITD
ncbi:MAG: MgtC/SapB family protein [Eubacterium sp.]